MSKKKRKTDKPAAPIRPGLPPFPMAISVPPELARRMGLLPERPSVTVPEVVAMTREGAGDKIDRIWSVECSRACCNRPERDGVLVVALSEAHIAAHQARHPESDIRALNIGVFDAHAQDSATAIIDVEDAKRLVNALAEAIAHVEAREGVR